MKKYIILILALTFLSACRVTLNPSKEYLKSISFENNFTSGAVITIPVNLDGDKKNVLNDYFHSLIYKDYLTSQYATYFDFLYDLYYLPENINFREIKEWTKSSPLIDIKSIVFQEYNSKGIEFIVNKYFIKHKDSYELIDMKYKEELIDIMFYNGFYIYQDDYSGKFIFNKMPPIYIDNILD